MRMTSTAGASPAAERLKYITAVVLYGTIGYFLRFVSLPSELVAMCRGLIGGGFILLFMLAFRLEGWRVLKANFKQPAPYLVGVFSFMAYFLVLGAMSFVTNGSDLQAFRQMSLPLGVLAGVYFLKERFTLPKAIGTAMVVFGLVLTVV